MQEDKLHEENKTTNFEFEMIERNYDHDKKVNKIREEKRKYRNRARDSIFSYEIILWDIENKKNEIGSKSLSKKSEDDTILTSVRKSIIPESKRENKSAEKDNKKINLEIRKSLLTDLSKLVESNLKQQLSKPSYKPDDLNDVDRIIINDIFFSPFIFYKT